jgi:integrase/recombinase XerD
MPTVKLYLDTRRIKQSGLYPLVIRFRQDNNYFDFNTGTSLLKSDFDPVKEKIKGQVQQTAELHQLRNQLNTRFLQLITEGHSFNQIKSILLNKEKATVTIAEFWQQEIQRLISSGRAGGANVYKSSYVGLCKVMEFSRPFKELTLNDLLKAEAALRKSGLATNSVGVYMRSLRAICNKAINLDLVDQGWYPFRKYTIRKEKTVPRALSLAELQSYFNLHIEPSHKLFQAHQMGKLIFLLRGINLKDLVLLNSASVHNDRAVYKRSKTGKLYNVNLHRYTKEVLESIAKPGTIALIPTAVSQTAIHSDIIAVNRYNQVRKVFNDHLQELGKMAGLSINLSSYVFRYSYANIAKTLGYSKDLIAEALGHEYGNAVTGIYLEMFDSEKLDEMHNEIVRNVIGGV